MRSFDQRKKELKVNLLQSKQKWGHWDLIRITLKQTIVNYFNGNKHILNEINYREIPII